RLALARVRRDQGFPLRLGQPEVVTGCLVAARELAGAAAELAARGPVQDARVDVDDQRSGRRRPCVGRIDLAGVGDRDRTRLALGRGQLLPIAQGLLEDTAHHGRVVVIAIGQQLAARGEYVNALARRAAVALARALVGHAAKELALGVLAAAL